MPITSRAAQVLSDLGVAVRHERVLVVEGENSSQSAAGAKPSRLRKQWPFMMVREVRTMPWRPKSALWSTSSLPSRSGSYPKSRRNQLSFHKSSGGAIEPPGKRLALMFFGLENREADCIEGPLRMPAIEGTFDAYEEDTFQYVVAIAIFEVQTRDVSLHELTSCGLREAVQVTKKGRTIVGGAFGQVIDEGFDLLSAGIVKGSSSAVIGGISLHQSGIELMLANQQAETITEARRGGMAVAVCSASRRIHSVVRIGGGRCSWRPTEFLDRAEADAIGLPESSIDGAGLGHAHFGTTHEDRNIRGIGISITDVTSAACRFVNCSFENPMT